MSAIDPKTVPKVVDLTPQIDEDVVGLLQEMLDKAKAGELDGVVLVANGMVGGMYYRAARVAQLCREVE